ncbi:hypothetical protein PUR49_02880 [Streptomyces sp. BE147]|uniref:hypothetical protein n=1 Tax=Streptomyces sp. BE147 TaxID=3002524 RepID=UPI002E769389|nr:hypothetical protein [Streptomyces sp. BE147]MEE1735481.1 hypothetical protein [Streptomyces sp. BE147]
MIPDDEYEHQTGSTGQRDTPPPLADQMAAVLQLWDATTCLPRTDGDYLVLALDLLRLDEDQEEAW